MHAWRTARAELGVVRRLVQDRRDPRNRRVEAAVRRGMTLPPIRRAPRRHGEVWAVTMVKNELDVLPQVLDHLEAQGVARILVADNGSSDGTAEMLVERSRHGRVMVATDREPAYYQAVKMSLLARAAWRGGADWVVPFDADEFWFGRGVPLVEALRGTEGEIVTASIYNIFPRADGTVALDPVPARLTKVAFRSHPFTQVSQGNHTVLRPTLAPPVLPPPLRIAHYPWRSLGQLRRKVTGGTKAYAATDMGDTMGGHWRRADALDDDGLRHLWEAIEAGANPLPVDLDWVPSGRSVDLDPRGWDSWPVNGPETR